MTTFPITRKTKTIIFLVNFCILLLAITVQLIIQVGTIRKEFDFKVENLIAKGISNKMYSTYGILSSLTTHYQAQDALSPSTFAFVSKALFNNYSYLRTILFASTIGESDKQHFVNSIRQSGLFNYTITRYDNDSGRFVLANQRAKYAPIVAIEPANHLFTQYYGYDLLSNEDLASGLETSSATGNISVKKTSFNGPGNPEHYYFIKATYRGELEPQTVPERIYETNGYCLISINLAAFLADVRKRFPAYSINIMDTVPRQMTLAGNRSTNLFAPLSYLEFMDKFPGNYLAVTSTFPYGEINFKALAFITLLVIAVQVMLVLLWVKDTHLKDELKFQAYHDSLTGLPNRLALLDKINKAIKAQQLRMAQTSIAVIFIDLDRFKEINDSFGHKKGDEVLQELANRFLNSIRETDTICRLGGDEFVVLVENLNSSHDALLVVNKLLDCMTDPFLVENNRVFLTLSMGIALFPDNSMDADDLLKYADAAMYKAKDDGRNTFQFYSRELTEMAMERIMMETKIRLALKEREFSVHFQPQYDGATNKLVGMEALARWKDKENNFISPEKFIPIAENTGLIVKLDQLIMELAIGKMSRWRRMGLQPGRLSMNLSMKELQQPDFIYRLTKIINFYNCSPEDIELEITESELMKNPEESIEKLNQLSEYGVRLSIDDFGTGYSSLSYLKRLPLNKLKIDRSFVMDLPDNEDDRAISTSIIALAKSLKLDVIAEGVENKRQLDFLLERGCTTIQGYYFSKPLAPKEMEALLYDRLQN